MRELSNKLNMLIEFYAEQEGLGNVSLGELVSRIYDKTGYSISKSYLSELRTGVSKEPKMSLIQALADFFEVSPAYFFHSPKRALNEIGPQEKHSLIESLKKIGANDIALRSTGISNESLKIIVNIINQIRKMEGLSNYQDTIDIINNLDEELKKQ